jgi:hypothetical protein
MWIKNTNYSFEDSPTRLRSVRIVAAIPKTAANNQALVGSGTEVAPVIRNTASAEFELGIQGPAPTRFAIGPTYIQWNRFQPEQRH